MMQGSDVLAEEYEAREEGMRSRTMAREIYLRDLRDILAMENGAGRRVFKSLLHRLGLFGYVWRRGADVHNTSSRHDAALEIYRDLSLADRAAASGLYTDGVADAEGK